MPTSTTATLNAASDMHSANIILVSLSCRKSKHRRCALKSKQLNARRELRASETHTYAPVKETHVNARARTSRLPLSSATHTQHQTHAAKLTSMRNIEIGRVGRHAIQKHTHQHATVACERGKHVLIDQQKTL